MIPYFSTGTVEEYIKIKRKLSKVSDGLNATTGPQKYILACSIFHGTAATTFNSAAHGLTETSDNFATVMNTVTRSIFPPRAAQTQKRYMRRFLRKPKDIGIHEHVAQVTELNEYFEEYLNDAGNRIDPIPDDEILDNLDFGNPNSWQREMILHDYDPLAHNITEFVSFCERLERVEMH